MRIAILGGGGAMGGLFGGYLARGGHDVTLIDVSQPAIEAINADGLAIEEKDGSQPVIRVPATDDPASVGPVDLVINFVKCYHTEAAVRGRRADDRPRHRRAQPAERLGQRAAHRRRSSARTGCWSASPITAARCSGPGRVKHPGIRHDPCRRARRADRATGSARWSQRLRAGAASRRRRRRASSTRSGRSWRSTPARCRRRRCCASSPTSWSPTTAPQAMMAAILDGGGRGGAGAGHRARLRRALGGDHRACWRRRWAPRRRCCRTSRRGGGPRSR